MKWKVFFFSCHAIKKSQSEWCEGQTIKINKAIKSSMSSSVVANICSSVVFFVSEVFVCVVEVVG